MKYFPLLVLAALTACAEPPGNEAVNRLEGSSEIDSAAEELEKSALLHPVHYCFKRIGQIHAEPKRGEECRASSEGAGGANLGPNIPIRNDVTFTISSPSLSAVGAKSFSFVLNRGDSAPKFITGVHVMDQVQFAGTTKAFWELPDRMGFVNDATGKDSIFSYSSPDAMYMRSKAPDYVFPGFEIISASLTIDSAIDMPKSEFELKFESEGEMERGKQYIEGSLTLILTPMGSKGEMFGPAIFEFGTFVEWGYFKQ